MKEMRRWLLAVIMTAASAAAAGLLLWGCGGESPPSISEAPLVGKQAGEEIPGRFIVALREDVDPDEVIREHGLLPELTFRTALKGFAGALSPVQVEALRKDPRVTVVEPDRVVTVFGETTPTGVNRIDADLNLKIDLSPIGIAIIDTGIWKTHEDLNVAGGVNFVTTVKTWNDDNGHGTHVAGIAAAKAGNGVGVRGVAPNARLYAVKVLNRTGSGYLSWVIAGVDWVTANAANLGIKVANMSLGFQGTSTALDDAIAKSVKAGVVYVVAAGNSSADASSFSPANHPDVITVSAMADSDGSCGAKGPSTSYGADDTFATFSNYGSLIELAAPGVNIYSTWKGDKTHPYGTYRTLSGTSMAAPHVAGAAALYLASNPGASPADVRNALITMGTPQQPVECTDDGTGRMRGGFSGDPDTYPEPLVDAPYL
jgi:subtilisin family serine protease